MKSCTSPCILPIYMIRRGMMRGQNFSKQNHCPNHVSGMAMAGIRVSLPNTASINKVQNTASAQCLARFSYNITYHTSHNTTI